MHSSLICLNLIIPFIVTILIPAGRFGSLTIIVDTIILPGVLSLLNLFLVLKNIESPLRCFLFMLLGLLLGVATGYIVWGVSSKNFFTPDAETIWIIGKMITYYLSFSVIACTLIHILKSAILIFSKK